MNPLHDILSPLWRRRVYVGYALLGLATGAVQVSYSALNHGQPDVLTVWLALYSFFGTALGFTAASNVTIPDSADEG